MKHNYVLGLIGLVLIVGGIWWWQTSSAMPASSVTTPVGAAEKNFPLTIANKKITSGMTTLSVNKGDSVTLSILCDEDEELHLHGYDVSADLTANVPATLTFIASTSGRFPFELEHSKTELGAVEVNP